MIRFTLNGRPVETAAPPPTPLLWVIREDFDLVGTKYGCGIAVCGACTVLLDGQPVRSCSVPVGACGGRAVATIEGLAQDGGLHPLQQAWIDEQVPQCGYCQSGMLMAAAALLATKRDPSDEDIDAAITNICRCGTYPRVRRAIHAAAARMKSA
ncbi:MAG TPA: (2Fe-2S)-binding protein [Burkholderiaceae bacterium]|nr:(2Fe-2S)-binding protein [Burkholderiaceae bacterium]